MLDFGGQYSQLIARRIRECGVFSELLPHDAPLEELQARRPRGLVLSGGPASVYSDDAPPLRPRAARARRSRCSASATACRRWRSSSAATSRAPRWASSAAPSCTCASPGRLLAGLPARAELLDEPPRHRLRAARRASPRWPRRRPRRWPRSSRSSGPVRDPVPPRGRAHAARHARCCETFLRDVCGCESDWTPGLGRRRAGGADPRAGRRGPRDLRAVGRRRLLGRGADRAPRARRPAHLRARRPRPAAQERGASRW